MNIDLTRENFPVGEVEQLIGYVFKDKDLLLTAFTRSSYAHEHGGSPDNDRLEFLGDSVLSLIVTNALYKTGEPVGKLTAKKKKIVSTIPLSYVCEKNGFYKYFLLGNGDRKQFSLQNRRILEDLTESIIAAVYLDGGYECAKKFVDRFLISDKTAQILFSDHFSELKEICEKRKIEFDWKCSPIHDLSDGFICDIFLNGIKVSSASEAGAEIHAKQSAAKIALQFLNEQVKEN